MEFKSPPCADPADLSLTALFVTDPVSRDGRKKRERDVYKKPKSTAFTAAKWLADCKIYSQVTPAAGSEPSNGSWLGEERAI